MVNMRQELCPHYSVYSYDIEDSVRIIKGLPLERLEHIVRCLPADEAPEPGGYISTLKSAIVRLIADKTFRKVVTHTLPPRTDKEWRDHLFGELRRFGLDPHWYIRG